MAESVIKNELAELKQVDLLRVGDTGIPLGSNLTTSTEFEKYRFLLMKARGSDNKDGSVFVPVQAITASLRVVGTSGDNAGAYRFSKTNDTNIYFDKAPTSDIKIYQIYGYK